MGLYCGMDLHSNNVVIEITDETDKQISHKKVRNNLDLVLRVLSPHKESIVGIAVESTYNWYWLVDGLQAAGYRVHLVNTSAVRQYEGLKFGDDKSDALWLAHLLRLGILPVGYIYPKEMRSVRDLLRRRSSLVRQRTANLLSVMNILSRNKGVEISANEIKRLKTEELSTMISDENVVQAIASNLEVVSCLHEQIEKIESLVMKQVKLREEFRKLHTVDGIGDILALTIMLETGEISRFPTVGDYASYCRCVGSRRISNGKTKGRGNTKNGNSYLAWAYIEAANFAIRFNKRAHAFYQRKLKKTKRVVAVKAVAHKLARACYFIMRDKVDFDDKRAFA